MAKSIAELRKMAEMGVFTHSGSFHADDVLSAALLCVAGVIDNPYRINRVNQPQEGCLGLCFDVGLGDYDHHQKTGFKVRNGDPSRKYAAFGLLWNAIGEEVLVRYGASPEAAKIGKEYFDKRFVEPTDLTDNFGPDAYPNTFSYMVSCQIPIDGSSDETTNAFYQLVQWMLPIFSQMITSVVSYATKIQIAQELGTEKVVVIRDGERFIPAACFKGTNAQFIVSKSNRADQWNVNAVPPHLFKLEKADMKGCVFQHTAKFISAFDTLDNAIAAANLNVE